MAGEKVLIVDDDKEFLEELKEMLISSGYDVTTVSESSSAVRLARKVQPDVILLDLKMRSMSGFEVADELKRYADTAVMPVIAISGFYAMDERSWLMNFCGFKKCLKKPFNPLNVIAQIESVLTTNRNKGKVTSA